jgi:hypothetical protein
MAGNDTAPNVADLASRLQRAEAAVWGDTDGGGEVPHRKEVRMDSHHDPRERLDLHNSNIDFDAASAGRCGVTHLDTGRICRLAHRHQGPCLLQVPHRTAKPAARALLG